ncbi:MAG: hypothetical protein QOE15_62, partial [Acidimicrobiaceae bacterium]|nr:hypothetical protein [Acidimicrobiaceae bacterium]
CLARKDPGQNYLGAVITSGGPLVPAVGSRRGDGCGAGPDGNPDDRRPVTSPEPPEVVDDCRPAPPERSAIKRGTGQQVGAMDAARTAGVVFKTRWYSYAF